MSCDVAAAGDRDGYLDVRISEIQPATTEVLPSSRLVVRPTRSKKIGAWRHVANYETTILKLKGVIKVLSSINQARAAGIKRHHSRRIGRHRNCADHFSGHRYEVRRAHEGIDAPHLVPRRDGKGRSPREVAR